jgi:hypothetical protein
VHAANVSRLSVVARVSMLQGATVSGQKVQANVAAAREN